MVKATLLLLMISISSASFCQNPGNNFFEKKHLFVKSKRQNTAAWLLLTGGVLMTSSGYVLFIYEGLRGDGVKSIKAKLDVGLFFTGIAVAAASIPLFSASAKNKRAAMLVRGHLKMENNISKLPSPFVKSRFPAISISIDL